MKARCHQCGREYLAARNLAGQSVACRSCGARNDAGGAWSRGPGSPSGKAAAGPASPRMESGQILTVDDGQVPPPASIPEPAHGPSRPRPELYRRLNQAVLAVASGLLALALVGAISILIVSRLQSGSDGDWEPIQRAVPQIVSSYGTGSGFVTEIDGRLWLVTSYHTVDGAGRIRAIFRDPPSGASLFSIELRVHDARVHDEFLSAPDLVEPGAGWDMVGFDIESWRPQFEGVGIEPLEILDAGRLRVGSPVVALGHPGTGIAGNEGGDEDARSIAAHSLVKGVVSAMRSEPGKPKRVQTDAEIAPGYSGGPLVLEESGEVVAVNAWKDVDAAGRPVAGMAFSLAADQVPALVADGVRLASIRDRIAASSTRALPADVEHPEKTWSRFAWLDQLWESCRRDGWRWMDSVIHVTGIDGEGHLVHRIKGGGPQEVAVLVFPESPLVDLDVESLGPPEGPFASGKEPQEGAPTFVECRDSGGGRPIELPPESSIRLSVSTWFLGEPVKARYVAIFVQKGLPAPAPTSPSAPRSGRPSSSDFPILCAVPEDR